MNDLSNFNNINFQIAVANPENSEFSLDLKDADFANNQVILNSLVGTLVKYGPSGRIEPYIAQTWQVSDDKKKWTFHFRDKVYFDDGIEINAKSFKKILESNLKQISKTSESLVSLDHLVGIKKFLNNEVDNIEGLRIDGNSLTFDFEKTPDDLLELLRMPYFGLWRTDEKNQLVSSAAYRIHEFKANRVVLQLRKDWFTSSLNSANQVIFEFVSLQKSSINTSSIRKLPFFFEEYENSTFYWIKSPPTRLEAFVLSPTKNNFFNIPENRKLFANNVYNLNSDLVKSRFLYPSSPSRLNLEEVDEFKLKKSKKLQFALERLTYTEQEIINLKKILTNTLKDSGLDFELIERDPTDKKWFDKTDSNHFFDARVTSVDIGAHPEEMVLKMMFCSSLGVKFPDPRNKMCEFLKTSSLFSSKHDQIQIEKLNQIIYDDAVVIPLFHNSEKWIVSKNINPRSLPPTTIYPQFELIEIYQ